MTTPVTSEARVVFAPLQQATSADVLAVGTLGQQSVDNVVENILYAGLGYQGLSASITGTAELTVSAGYLLDGGPAYALRDPFVLDLSTAIGTVPDSSKTAIVLILADGAEPVTSETRTFLDPSKKPNNPADPWPTITYATNTRAIRQVVIPQVRGAADVQPQTPVYPAQLCLIATAVVSNTGILGVTQNTAQQITRLDQIVPIVTGLASQTAGFGSAIAGLLASVAALRMTDDQRWAATQTSLASLQNQINVLVNKLASLSAPGSTFIITDTYIDGSGLTLQANNPTYTVGSGLGFPPATTSPGTITPINPNAGNIKIIGNKLLPAYTETTYNLRDDASTTIAFNSLPAVTMSPQDEGFGVNRIRYGSPYPAQSTDNLRANGDPSVIFAASPSNLVFNPSWPAWNNANLFGGPELNHQTGFWTDLSSRGYWAPRTPAAPISGTPAIGQILFLTQDIRLTRWDLPLQKGTTGDIRMLIVPATFDVGDFTSAIVDVTVPYAAIDPSASVGGLYGAASFVMPYPIYMKYNKEYLVFFFSSGDHKLRAVLGTTTDQTTIPGSIGGAYTLDQNGRLQQMTQIAGLCNKITVASFTAGKTKVPLVPFFLGGGTDKIDVVTPAIVPIGSSINLSMLSNGSYVPLQPISAAAPNLLAQTPSTIPLQLELNGSTSTAPMIDLGASASGSTTATATKQAGTLSAESSVRAPKDASGNPLAITKVNASVTLVGFDPTIHTFTEQLEPGPGYGTQVPPTTTATPVKQPDGTYTLAFAWTLGTGVTTFKQLYQGTTTDTTRPFTVSQATATATP